MSQSDELSRQLPKQNGSHADSRQELESQLARLMKKEKSRIRQSIVITIALWVGVLCTFLFRLPTGADTMGISGHDPTALELYLAVFSQWLPLLAAISTIVLLIRLRIASGRDLRRRMARIEEQLRRLEENTRREP